jgi:hypothetical protein
MLTAMAMLYKAHALVHSGHATVGDTSAAARLTSAAFALNPSARLPDLPPVHAPPEATACASASVRRGGDSQGAGAMEDSDFDGDFDGGSRKRYRVTPCVTVTVASPTWLHLMQAMSTAFDACSLKAASAFERRRFSNDELLCPSELAQPLVVTVTNAPAPVSDPGAPNALVAEPASGAPCTGTALGLIGCFVLVQPRCYTDILPAFFFVCVLPVIGAGAVPVDNASTVTSPKPTTDVPVAPQAPAMAASAATAASVSAPAALTLPVLEPQMDVEHGDVALMSSSSSAAGAVTADSAARPVVSTVPVGVASPAQLGSRSKAELSTSQQVAPAIVDGDGVLEIMDGDGGDGDDGDTGPAVDGKPRRQRRNVGAGVPRRSERRSDKPVSGGDAE